MKNSSSRRKFRNLAFELQYAKEENKISILNDMVEIMDSETDPEEIKSMQNTICVNIIVHNIVIGSINNEYNIPFTLASNSQ